MVALLKQKSKIITERKPRKTYEVKPIFKRKKVIAHSQDNRSENSVGLFNFDGQSQQMKKIIPTKVDVVET